MWLLQVLRTIFITVDYVAALLVQLLFSLFSMIANVTLSTTIISEFANKIYAFLGIIMLFKLAFSFINYIINPDTMEDQTKGTMGTFKSLFVVLILIFATPMVFKVALQLQKVVLDEMILERLIMKNTSTNSNYDGTKNNGKTDFGAQGKAMAFAIYSAFITPNEEVYGSLDEKKAEQKVVKDACADFYKLSDGMTSKGVMITDYPANATICMNYLLSKSDMSTDFFGIVGDKWSATFSGEFNIFELVESLAVTIMPGLAAPEEITNMISNATAGFNARVMLQSVSFRDPYFLLNRVMLNRTAKINGEKVFIFNYVPLITTACALFIAYVLLLFCFDLAVRAIKLGFLQLIAPIPIVSYIDPQSAKSGLFKKWVTTSAKTYADLFIRLAIMYFSVYLITLVIGSDDGFVMINENDSINFFVRVFLLLGILKFAKEFPRLIQEITGIDLKGNFTLNLGKKIGDIPVAGRLANKAIASTMGALSKDMKGASLGERIKHGYNIARKNNEIGWGGDNKSIFANTETKRRKEEKEKIITDDIEARREMYKKAEKWDKGKASLTKVPDLNNEADYRDAGFTSAEYITADMNYQLAKKQSEKGERDIYELEQTLAHTDDVAERTTLTADISKAKEKQKGLEAAVSKREEDLTNIGNKKENIKDKKLAEARKTAKHNAPRPITSSNIDDDYTSRVSDDLNAAVTAEATADAVRTAKIGIMNDLKREREKRSIEESKINNNNSKISEDEQKIITLKDANKQLESEKNQCNLEISKAEIEKSKARGIAMKSAIQDIINDLDSRVFAIDAEIISNKATITTLDSHIRGLQMDNSTIQTAISFIDTEITRLEGLLRTL